jgi:hypothetical protein
LPGFFICPPDITSPAAAHCVIIEKGIAISLITDLYFASASAARYFSRQGRGADIARIPIWRYSRSGMRAVRCTHELNVERRDGSREADPALGFPLQSIRAS